MVRWRSLLIGGAISAVCIALLLRSVDLAADIVPLVEHPRRVEAGH